MGTDSVAGIEVMGREALVRILGQSTHDVGFP